MESIILLKSESFELFLHNKIVRIFINSWELVSLDLLSIVKFFIMEYNISILIWYYFIFLVYIIY